jgi:hypothetical protein
MQCKSKFLLILFNPNHLGVRGGLTGVLVRFYPLLNVRRSCNTLENLKSPGEIDNKYIALDFMDCLLVICLRGNHDNSN